ncbi:hypothetical protein DQ384_09935 [Sphaerisporangium album]|uniref:Uncharacterized protein n=1 Tax=Sphaerisporangium album TaxID=509200 RepID=A0A367FN67_9ACTN|nr:hypothetical protein [Sphaerisporangium album]RCG31836.1 hypothetical protein DQ384_09935 [Sphaerisporangium album]
MTVSKTVWVGFGVVVVGVGVGVSEGVVDGVLEADALGEATTTVNGRGVAVGGTAADATVHLYEVAVVPEPTVKLKSPGLTVNVPTAVGTNVAVIVGIGMGEPADTVASGV